MPYVILLVALGIFVPDLYIWNTFVKGGRAVWSVIYWIPSVLFICLTGFSMLWKRFNAGVMNIFTALLLGVALPKAVFALVAWLADTSSAMFPLAGALGFYFALALAVFVMTLSFYGLFFGWKVITVKKADLYFENLPREFEGYRIAQISDFHIGTYLKSADSVGRIVESLNALKPDIVAFTGDLVNLSPAEVRLFVPVLSDIKATDGVVSILGNHDYCGYVNYPKPGGRAEAQAELESLERRAGWRLLKNEHLIVTRGESEMAIVGVENDGRPPFPARADLKKAMDGLPEEIFVVLLSHDPTHWRRNVLPETDIPLMLAGHTHGMQFQIGRFSPSKYVYPEWGGLYREGNRMLYVSTGVGSNLKFRFGVWPEIVLLTLHSAGA